jgi:phosphatidylserine/phosphatidylglycerophosphate/cardiolipin synthase-like enzyme
MPSVQSLARQPDAGLVSAPQRARIRVLTRDPFGAFVRATLRERPRRISVVSPWVGDRGLREASLRRLLQHAVERHCGVVLVTRPPVSDGHAAAVELARTAPRGCVYFNSRLHAKLYVCESVDGRGLAVVGSANCTDGSMWLDEFGVLVRPEDGSQIISELGGRVIRSLSRDRARRATKERAR